MEIPDSPSLPQQEVDAPQSIIPAQLGAELDLDDSEDEIEQGHEKEESKINCYINNNNYDTDMDIDTDNKEEEEDINKGGNPLSFKISKDINYQTPMIDFSDNSKPINSIINPFEMNNKNGGSSKLLLSSSDSIPILINNNKSIQKLNDLQEQKLIEYIDENLLNIQRGFVKFLSSKEENNENLKEGYQFSQLMLRIDEIIEFIWYTITQIKGIPIIYHLNIFNNEYNNNQLINSFKIDENELDKIIKMNNKLDLNSNLIMLKDIDKNKLYVSFIIKIMGDLIDYIIKYDFNYIINWILILRLTAKIDNFLSILIDYSNYTTNHYQLVNNTDKVRISSLVQRTKITLVEIFDHYMTEINNNNNKNSNLRFDIIQTVIGEVYEGVIDRVSDQ